MTDTDALAIILAWESGSISALMACAALGITRDELIEREMAAIGRGRDLARQHKAAWQRETLAKAGTP